MPQEGSLPRKEWVCLGVGGGGGQAGVGILTPVNTMTDALVLDNYIVKVAYGEFPVRG